MEPGSTWQYMALVVLLILSAFFSMSETALTSINKLKLRHMLDENVKGAALVGRLLADPKKLITTLLVGNNIANLASSALTTVIALKISNGKNMLVGVYTVLLTLTIIIFCEVAPKNLAVVRCETISILLAKPVYVFVVALTPLTFILGKITTVILSVTGGGDRYVPLITEDELKTVVAVGHEEGVIEVEERQMINNVFDFGDYDAKDLMIPRTDIVAVSVDASAAEIRETFMTERFSRLPVYKENTDNIIGILYMKDFFFLSETGAGAAFNIESCMREPFFTYESKAASQLFMIMRTKRIPMAIVIDEYGGTAGLITLEDLIEEIVGDISDEYDEVEEDIECVKEDEFIVDGSAKISDVNEMIGTRLESEDFDSIGGYAMGAIGRVPIKGDVVDCGNIKLIVEETEKNRVEKLRILIQ